MRPLRPRVTALFLTAASLLAPTLSLRAAAEPPVAASPYSPATGLRLTINNKQRLVTVKDGNGAWLFGQVIATPELVLEAVPPTKKQLGAVTLRDATGRKLWAFSIAASSRGGNFQVGAGSSTKFDDKGVGHHVNGGITITVTPPEDSPGESAREEAPSKKSR
jgi:hypothetical protein